MQPPVPIAITVHPLKYPSQVASLLYAIVGGAVKHDLSSQRIPFHPHDKVLALITHYLSVV